MIFYYSLILFSFDVLEFQLYSKTFDVLVNLLLKFTLVGKHHKLLK